MAIPMIRMEQELWTTKEKTDPTHKNYCDVCKTAEHVELQNYSMMWHDGDMICTRCGKYIRMWDAG